MRLSRCPYGLLLFSVVACADRGASGGGEAGGTLVVAVGGNAAPVLPPVSHDVFSRAVADQVYDRLADMGPDLNTLGDKGFTPRLARSWAWSADSLSIAFAIDPRARWHDGTPVRASDVRFTFDLVKDPTSATSLTGMIANIDSVTVRDSLTAVAWYHRRTPEQFYDLVYQLHVLPEHVLKDLAHDKLETADINTKMIGSGRFRLARFEPGVRIEVVADTLNYRGRPKLDRVVWAIASDAGAAVTQLFSGQADLIEILPPQMVPRADSTGSIRVVRYPSLGYAYMGMNQRDSKRPGGPHQVLGDRNVRRAISMGLDRQAMLKNVFDTLGIIGVGPYPRVLADTTVRVLPFDRERAAALLDSAGWRAGADGMRSKNGRPLAFSILVPTSSAPRMRYAVLIQEQAKSIGLRVDIESMDFQTFQNRLNNRAFDAMISLWQPDPNVASIKEVWGTEGIARGGQNIVSYSSRTFDALIDSASTVFDAARAKQYAHRAYQTLVDDAPAVFLYDNLTLAGMHKRLRPVEMRANGWWFGLADWSIPASERIERDRIGLRPAQP
jgi:peptide/nickel transport system substrate-binding protein